MPRIPHDGTSDGESRLHPCDIKYLHLNDGLILLQVRVDEFAFTECLQGVRNSASEFNIASLNDSGRPEHWNNCREKIGCMAEGENE